MSDGFATLVVDPPMGSKYGFPRAFTFKPSHPGLTKAQEKRELEAWFRACGYPQTLIDQGMLQHLRFWPLRRDNG